LIQILVRKRGVRSARQTMTCFFPRSLSLSPSESLFVSVFFLSVFVYVTTPNFAAPRLPLSTAARKDPPRMLSLPLPPSPLPRRSTLRSGVFIEQPSKMHPEISSRQRRCLLLDSLLASHRSRGLNCSIVRLLLATGAGAIFGAASIHRRTAACFLFS